jgi:hypothetical protein
MCTAICQYSDCLNKVTSFRVSKGSLEALERLKKKLEVESLDETIQALIKQQRKASISKSFGQDKDRIKPFTEKDRGEDRS